MFHYERIRRRGCKKGGVLSHIRSTCNLMMSSEIIYKLKKALCGLDQASRAWYDRLIGT